MHTYPLLAPVADQLHQHALTTVGDLHTGQRWMALNHFPEALQPHLQPILQGPPQPTPDRSPHPGRFWHLSPTPPQHSARTIYEILPDPDPHGTQYARPWLTMNPHSHLNPVPGDTYYWTPQAPHTVSPAHPLIHLTDIPSTTTWKKVLCQPTTHTDNSGRLLRRILSIIDTDPPQTNNNHLATSPFIRRPDMELTHPLPHAYTIYVDGGWDTTNADFTTAFQEQRDPPTAAAPLVSRSSPPAQTG